MMKEARLPLQGREVLYVVGYAVIDTSCCGIGGCAYALVPGFIMDWRYKRNEDGLTVSQVEPIHDEAIQKEVRRLIEREETVRQVSF